VDLEGFRKGIIIGFAVAAPVGPIGVLVIQRSLGAAVVGLATGLGAAAADALYALAGALATAFALRMLSATWIMELIGAAVLGWLAARTWAQAPALQAPAVQRPAKGSQTLPVPGAEAPRPASPLRLARAFGETLFLTLANPATILSFAAVSASQGFGSRTSAYVFATGVFAGSAAWWLLLSTGVRFGSRRLSSRAFDKLHIASGMVLAAYAALAFVKAVSDFR
jgi:arginine exporter protein ArgO